MSDDPRSSWERLRDADMIAALAAVFIGVCALAVSIYQSALMREQQQASVWPHVEIGRTYRGGDAGDMAFKLIVNNSGIGPARLITFRVKVDGEHQQSWQGVVKKLGVPDAPIQSWTSVQGRVLLPAHEIVAVSAADKKAVEALEKATTSAPPRILFEICYCSIYQVCYRRAFGPYEEQPVARCAADPKLDFRD